MGQIAEDIIDGSCCQECQCYFKAPEGGIYYHDYPVTCWDCYDDMDEEDQQNCIKADVPTY